MERDLARGALSTGSKNFSFSLEDVLLEDCFDAASLDRHSQGSSWVAMVGESLWHWDTVDSTGEAQCRSELDSVVRHCCSGEEQAVADGCYSLLAQTSLRMADSAGLGSDAPDMADVAEVGSDAADVLVLVFESGALSEDRADGCCRTLELHSDPQIVHVWCSVVHEEVSLSNRKRGSLSTNDDRQCETKGQNYEDDE